MKIGNWIIVLLLIGGTAYGVKQVDTAGIANSAVTNAKMANMAAHTIKGNITAGAAAPVDSSLSAILDAELGSSQGSIMYRGAASWSVLSPGTSGFFLKTQGAAADPTWASASASPLTTKGDIWGFSTVDDRLPVGTDGQILTSDSSASLGVAWADAPSSSAVTKAIAQTAHGFAVGDVVYFNGTSYAKAKADADATSEIIGMVSAVADANNFTLTTPGGYVTGLSGRTAGNTSWLSDATAGAITDTEPSTVDHLSCPLFVADSTTSGFFFKMRCVVIADTTNTGPRSEVYVDTGAGVGATNTSVQRFTNVRKNTGDITYASSSTLGDSFTVGSDGVYTVTFAGAISAGTSYAVITVDGSALSSGVSSQTYAVGGRCATASTTSDLNAPAVCAWTGNLTNGQVIRFLTNGTSCAADFRCRASVVKVSN